MDGDAVNANWFVGSSQRHGLSGDEGISSPHCHQSSEQWRRCSWSDSIGNKGPLEESHPPRGWESPQREPLLSTRVFLPASTPKGPERRTLELLFWVQALFQEKLFKNAKHPLSLCFVEVSALRDSCEYRLASFNAGKEISRIQKDMRGPGHRTQLPSCAHRESAAFRGPASTPFLGHRAFKVQLQFICITGRLSWHNSNRGWTPGSNDIMHTPFRRKLLQGVLQENNGVNQEKARRGNGVDRAAVTHQPPRAPGPCWRRGRRHAEERGPEGKSGVNGVFRV